MTDRVDIDALLIGALYGELTPAEEARLTAHLESHPADRTALADLTHTRTAIRESRILSVQLEPPQSVSALLLQEAARRAPRPEREAVGWFHRFTRSFMMHPAMAAAAMLVLVVGVAGTMYLRHGDQFAEMAPPASTSPASTSDEARAQDLAQEKAAQAEKTAAAAQTAAAEPGQAYRVGLDEPAGQPEPPAATAPPAQVAQVDRQVPAGRAKATTVVLSDEKGNEAKESNEAKRGEAQERPLDVPARPAAPMPAKLATKGNAGLGVELRGPEMAPKDLDDETDRKLDKKQDVARRDPRNADTANDRVGKFAADADKVAAAPGAAPSGGGGATALPSMMPQNHAAAAGPAADPAAVIASNVTSNTITGSSAGAKSKAPAKPAPRSAPAQGLAQSAAAADARPTEERAEKAEKAEKSAEDKALIGWAQKQRDQVLAFVKSNNCRAAARAAIAIYNRAPRYYAENIETDRSIKSCMPYVTIEREREDRSRAAMKRANAADAPAAAPPPPARK